MVRTLHQANVNTLWEHALNDNKNHKKKPTPKDPLYNNPFYSYITIIYIPSN